MRLKYHKTISTIGVHFLKVGRKKTEKILKDNHA